MTIKDQLRFLSFVKGVLVVIMVVLAIWLLVVWSTM